MNTTSIIVVSEKCLKIKYKKKQQQIKPPQIKQLKVKRDFN